MKQTNVRQGGGYFFSELSHGAKLWLGLILSFFCAVTLFCAFFVVFNKSDTAKAEEADSTFTPTVTITEERAWKSGSQTLGESTVKTYDDMTSIPGMYNVYTGSAIPYMGCEFNPTTAVYGNNYCGYIELEYAVEIPASTTVTINLTPTIGVSTYVSPAYYKKVSFGYLGDKPAKDIGGFSGMEILRTIKLDGETGGTSANPIVVNTNTSDTSTKTITFVNDTAAAKTFKRYFGLIIVSNHKSTSRIGDWFFVNIGAGTTLTKEIVAPVPQNVDTVYDPNKSQWLDNLSADWIDADTHLDSDYVEVKNIDYTSPEGEVTNLGTDTAEIKNAGKYSVTLGTKNIRWKDKTTGDKTFTITVAKKDITGFNPKLASGTFYEGTATSGFPAISLPDGWEIAGTVRWDDSQVLSETGKYDWTFTPDNVNYKVLNGQSDITVTKIKISSISAVLENTADIFTSTPLSELLARLKVTKTKNTGEDGGIADVSEIEFAAGTKLNAGTNVKLTVQLKSDTTITCEVELPEIKAVVPIELVVTHDGSAVYITTDETTLKSQLTVKIKNNDGSVSKTLEAEEFTFAEDFALADGAYTLEVFKSDDTDVSGSVLLTVLSAAVKSVTVQSVEIPEGVILWEGAAANTIKSYLTVEVVFDDGLDTKKTLTATDNYSVTVVGSEKNVLTSGQCSFNVSYGGVKSGMKTVTVQSVEVTDLTPVYVQGERIIYSSAKLEDLQTDIYLSVEAVFNNGTESTLDSDEYTLTLPENFSSENNEVTVTWKKGSVTKTATFTVTVTDVAPQSIKAEYSLPSGQKLDALCTAEALNDGLTVLLQYNDGSEQNLNADGYTLEVPTDKLHGGNLLAAGEITVTVKYGADMTGTFTVNVSKADFVPAEHGISFNNQNVAYDGEAHSIEIDGFLPDWLSVTYDGNGVSETGVHTVTAKFSHTDANYNAVADMTAKLTIGAGEYIAEFSFNDKTVEYSGTPQSIDLSGDVPEWITVAYFVNGENFEGATDIGEYVITAKFTHENETYGKIADMTAKLTITKARISAPKFIGNYSYTGEGIMPKSADFESFDSSVLKLEPTSAVKAGEGYKAQFTLLDTEHYEWMEEGANETVWQIGKAKLTASKLSGRLPEYSSEGYDDNFEGVVSYKYYTDANCTEEIHPDDLEQGKEYYVKAVLEDSENFELDETAFTFFELGFKHKIGGGEAESGETADGNFIKDNWMWIAIGAGALLLGLTLVIVLTRRKAPAEGYEDYDYDDEEDDDEEDDDDYDDYDGDYY